VTWLYIPEGFIIFGVLHFIGTSIIVWILFERFKNYNFIFGLVFIIIGFYIRTLNFDSILLLPFGFIPKNFWTVDYFPIFPWFGLILIGSVLGNIIFPNFKRRFHVPHITNNLLINIFSFLGRNSLIIYFIHQPIIIGIILLFFS